PLRWMSNVSVTDFLVPQKSSCVSVPENEKWPGSGIAATAAGTAAQVATARSSKAECRLRPRMRDLRKRELRPRSEDSSAGRLPVCQTRLDELLKALQTRCFRRRARGGTNRRRRDIVRSPRAP